MLVLRFRLLAILLLAATLFGCEKDPEVITKTVVQTDTIFVSQHDTVFIQLTDTLTLTEFIEDTATTFILLRHAETDGAGSDPSLSADGQERANELLRILKNVPLDAVYSTNFNRTLQTAQPTATDKVLSIQIYNPSAPGGLADDALENYHSGTVLVVGHSNTTPSLLNVLTGTNDFSQIPETQYDNIYLVTVFEKGRAKVTHMKYGTETP